MNALAQVAWLEGAFWVERCALLAGGSTAIVLVAAFLAARGSSARWQRGCWQAALVGSLALLIMEAVGVGDLAVSWTREWWRPAVAIDSEKVIVRHDTAMPIDGADARFTADSLESPASGLLAIVDVEPSAAQPDDLPAAVFYSVELEASAVPSLSPTVSGSAQAVPSNKPVPLRDVVQDSQPAVKNIPQWPLAVWGLGAAFCLLRWCIGWLRLRHLVRRAMPVDPACQRRAAGLASRLHLKGGFRLLALPGLAGPVAFGIRRPTVGLPVGFQQQFSPAEQDAILAHELAHLAAGDPAWRLLADIAAALWWWQPLAWWSRGKLDAASEAVADEASLLLDDGPQTLAACLVSVGQTLLQSQRLGWNGIEGGGFRSSLGRRVARLLNMHGRVWRAKRGGGLIVCTVAFLLAAVALASTAGVRRSIFHFDGESRMTIRQAWRRSLGGMAIVAALSTAANSAVADEGDVPTPPPPAEREAPPGPPPPPRPDERRGPPEGERRDKPDGERRNPEGDRRGPPERRPGVEGDIEARLGNLKQEIRRLREQSKNEDADRLEKEYQGAMSNMLKQILPQLPEEARGPIAERFEQYLKARNDGKMDDAERLEREFKQAMQPFQAKLVPPEQKLRHLRGAADNLRAAGKADLAEKLMQEVRELEQALGLPPMPEGQPRPPAPDREGRRPPEGDRPRPEGERREGDRPPEGRDRRDGDRREGGRREGDRPAEGRDRREGDRPPEGRDRRDGEGNRDRPAGREERREGGERREGADRRPDPGPQQDLARILQELRGEIENLRREVKELREKVKD
ncbi:MAG: M56 family metallopeptidase [Pirellulales bacterium]